MPDAIRAAIGTDRAADIREAISAHDSAARHSTGIDVLDNATSGGVREKQVFTIAALSGYGKSALAETIALAVSREARVLYCALEMGKEFTYQRLLARLHGTSLDGFYRDLNCGISEWADQAEATIAALKERQLRVVAPTEGTAWTVADCFAAAERMKARVLIIDYAGMLDDWSGIRPDGRMASKVAANDIQTRTLASGIATVVLHQLSPKTDPRRRPRAQDIADGNGLPTASHVVCAVHRPFYGEADDDVVELVLCKNRNNRPTTVHARWSNLGGAIVAMKPEELAEVACCKNRRKKRVRAEDSVIGANA